MSMFLEQTIRRFSFNNPSNIFQLHQQPQLFNDYLDDYSQKMSYFSVNSSSIRFIIYNEDTYGTRSVLFDSSLLQNNNLNSPLNSPNSISSPNCGSGGGGGGMVSGNISPNFNSSSAGSLNINSSNARLSTSSSVQLINTPKLDHNMLKRMVFGSVPMVVSNQNAMKVHSMKSSNKIMISNVFNHSHRQYQNCVHTQTDPSSASIHQHQQQSQPIKPKNGFIQINDNDKNHEKATNAFDNDNDDHEFNNKISISNHSTSNPVPILSNTQTQLSVKTTCSSFASSVNSNHSISPCSSMPAYGSYDCGVYKRLMRSVSSSLVSNNSNPMINYDENINESLNKSFNETNGFANLACKRCLRNNHKTKIGIAVIFTLSEADNLSIENFYEFFYSHLPIIECQVKELRSNIIDLLPLLFSQLKTNAIANIGNRSTKIQPIQTFDLYGQNSAYFRISKEVELFRSKFDSLYNSPRLSKPAWLTIIQNKKSENDNNKKQFLSICNRFINEFLYLCKNLNDLKTNNLFFSRILSTVLKYNLSWITTVLPNEMSQETNSLKLRKRKAYWTHILEKTNPYNPLWAQLGDLHGAVGHPLVLTRTVVIGKNKDLIMRILFVLSYFIRCSASCYFDVKQEEFDFNILKSLTNNKSPVASDNSLLNRQSSNEYDDQREISIFDLNSSPILNDAFKSPLKNSLLNISENNNEKYSTKINGKNHNDILLSPDIGSFDHISNFTKQMDSLINSNECINQMENNSKMKPVLDLVDAAANKNLDQSLFNSNNKNEHGGISFIRSNSSNDSSRNGTKQRHISSNSIGENCTAQELPLIDLKIEQNDMKSTRIQDNFGYSLLAGYCEKFVFEFVLHGTSDRSFLNTIHHSLKFSKQNSILDCPIDETMYIVVDTDNSEVKVYSSETLTPKVETNSNLIDSLVKSVYDLNNLFNMSDFLLLHLEDKLQELYFQSLALYATQSQEINNLNKNQLIKLMNIEENDYNLLNNIIKAIILPNNITMPKHYNTLF